MTEPTLFIDGKVIPLNIVPGSLKMSELPLTILLDGKPIVLTKEGQQRLEEIQRNVTRFVATTPQMKLSPVHRAYLDYAALIARRVRASKGFRRHVRRMKAKGKL